MRVPRVALRFLRYASFGTPSLVQIQEKVFIFAGEQDRDVRPGLRPPGQRI
ncbi:hypothetical protein HMPREF0239_01104 [Clostridium sp. ATCC BAA-442]|nr:hypothetical protein HMPREF0239_01104 [Clostridium sp. ATCC BAA-442]